MANPTTASVYKWVVDDVIAKMKPEVAQEGLDESVLDELRSLWETKLVQKGLLDADEPPAPSNAPVASLDPRSLPAPLLAAAFGASFTAQLAAATGGSLPNLGLKRDQPETGFDPAAQRRPQVPQQDGPADDDAGEVEEDAAEATEPEPAGDELLSSDSDEEEEEEDATCEHFLCCQFEKVSRTKNKWKIIMKEGVFHINGKDYLFKKAQGEWIF